MKKLLAVSILLTLLTAAAFAQLGISVYGDFYPDLMKITAPTGDNADQNNAAGGSGANPGKYAGVGTFDFLSSSNMTKGDNELRLELSYKDPKEGKYEGKLVLKGDKFMARYGGFYDGVVGSPGVDLKTMLTNLIIGDYYLKGTAGPLTGYVGNTSNRGATASFRFADFNNFIDNRKFDNFGLLRMKDDASGFDSLDVNNLQKNMKAPASAVASQLSTSYASLTASFAPISVDIAGDLGFIVDPTESANKESYSRAGAALRVSGSKLLDDFLNFDVIYKIHGADSNTDNNDDNHPQPDGNGVYDHSFGLYAGINVMKTLGLGVGYSGYVRTKESDTVGGETYKYAYPLFSGIDLRLKFTGVDKLSLIFNNNISFAGVTNDDDEKLRTVGIDGSSLSHTGTRDKELSQGYFAMANMLGLFYKVTDDLTGSFQVGNRLGTINVTDKRDESKEKKSDTALDQLWVAAGAEFTLGSNVLLGAALRLDVDSSSHKETDGSEYNGGLLTFGIPLRVKVKF